MCVVCRLTAIAVVVGNRWVKKPSKNGKEDTIAIRTSNRKRVSLCCYLFKRAIERDHCVQWSLHRALWSRVATNKCLPRVSVQCIWRLVRSGGPKMQHPFDLMLKIKKVRTNAPKIRPFVVVFELIGSLNSPAVRRMKHFPFHSNRCIRIFMSMPCGKLGAR